MLFQIRAVVSEFDVLFARIQADHICRIQVEEVLPISFFHNLSSEDRSSTNINGTFLHIQILIDTLISLKENPANKNELVKIAIAEYKDHIIQLNIIKEFESTYVSDRALWWYTRESFLYRLLNKAFRTQDIDLLFMFRFFIRDIQQQLKQLQKFEPANIMLVYRSQLMTMEEFSILQKSVGDLISMNSFLSTSLDRAYTLFLLGDSITDDGMKRILFEIEADTRLANSKSFADITTQSYFDTEQEVLFMAGSIFRLTSIQDNDAFVTVRMTLCGDDDNDLKTLYEYMRKDNDESLTTLGHVLCGLGKFDQAEQFYEKMLQELPPTDPNFGTCCRGLGSIYEIRGDYDRSLKWYQKTLDFWENLLSPDHEAIGHAHISIGGIHKRTKQFEKARQSFNKALLVWRNSYGEESQDVAGCYSNLGLIYSNEKNYDEALDYHQKALILREKLLPANHSDLAASHHNIGILYYRLGYLDLALEHCQRAIYIYTRCLPSDHPDIAASYVIISMIYENKGDLEHVLSYLKQAAAIYHKSLPPQHLKVIDVDRRITRVQERVEKK